MELVVVGVGILIGLAFLMMVRTSPGNPQKSRGNGILIAGSVGLLVAIGAMTAIYIRQRNRPTEVMVFHWIPGSPPLKMLGTPPFTEKRGDDASALLDRLLVRRLSESGLGGDLRLVGTIEIPSYFATGNVALLLRNLPKAPFTINFVDADHAVFYEHPQGIGMFPPNAPATGSTLFLAPGKNAQVDLLHAIPRDPSGKTNRECWAGIWWW